MSEKTYGRIAFEAFMGDESVGNALLPEKWEYIGKRVIEEYERRNGALATEYPTPELPNAEKIAEAIYSIYGDKWPNASDHDKSICMREAKAVLDLLQAKPVIAVDMAKPGSDSTVFCQITKEGLRLLEKQLAVIQQPTRGSPIPLDPPDDEPEETEEKQPETESQYQDRLLRALRDFG